MSNKDVIPLEYYKVASKCLNRIDDLLEYRYKGMDSQQLRDTILGYMEDFYTETRVVKGIKDGNK